MFDDFSDLQRELVGDSPAMLRLFKSIRKLAPIDITVLIEGESGTGKELVANALHRLSRRSRRLFVPVNCAGLTEKLAKVSCSDMNAARLREPTGSTLAGSN